jgi:hypothetical protein
MILKTHRTAVDARKLKLDKLNERKEKLTKWKDEKQMQKMLQKTSEKLVFKRGIVRHKVGSPYHNNISNMNYTGHAKNNHLVHQTSNSSLTSVIPSPPKERERAEVKPKQKFGGIPKISDVSKTLLNNTPKQYVQNSIRVNDNSPLGTSASSSYALDEASNNQINGILYFRTVLDSTESRLQVPGMASHSEFSE